MAVATPVSTVTLHSLRDTSAGTVITGAVLSPTLVMRRTADTLLPLHRGGVHVLANLNV